MMELTNACDIFQLENSLENSPRLLALPLRHQLHNIHCNVIRDGHIFVDHWPSYQYVCCLNTSHQFTNHKIHFDVATFYRKFDTSDTKMDSFETFLRELAEKRKWNMNRSLYANYVPLSDVDAFRRVLGKYGTLETYGEYFMNSAMERGNVEEYKRKLASLLPLPQELVTDTLRVDDAPILLETWTYAPSQFRQDYFRWLVTTFPSICLRNSRTGQLVAWVCSYSCGGIAHLFVQPEYRGTGPAQYLWLSIALKLARFTPVPVYFSIVPGNERSLRSAMKVFQLDHQKNDTLLTWFYFQNKAQLEDDHVTQM